MTVFYCKQDYESMLTCIYTAWASKLGHSNVRLVTGEITQQELFTDYVFVEADTAKFESVVRTIRSKISDEAYYWVYYACMSAEEDALDSIYRFLILGFKAGAAVCRMLQYPEVIRIMDIKKRVGGEAHLFREFLRFNCVYTQGTADMDFEAEPRWISGAEDAQDFAYITKADSLLALTDSTNCTYATGADSTLVSTAEESQTGNLCGTGIVASISHKKMVADNSSIFTNSGLNDRIYVAHIDPKSDVVIILAENFTDRMNCENWVIVDDTRKKAVIHPKLSNYYIRELTDDEMAALAETEKGEDYFTSLWKNYFESIAIKERANYVCQRTHFPLWMREHAVEFM